MKLAETSPKGAGAKNCNATSKTWINVAGFVLDELSEGIASLSVSYAGGLSLLAEQHIARYNVRCSPAQIASACRFSGGAGGESDTG